MDRKIPETALKQQRRKRRLTYGICGSTIVILLIAFISLFRSSVSVEELTISTAGRGSITTSVNASGKVVPAFEEIINSPIHTRIIEVYHKGGDSVDAGTPLLKLDLQSTETEYRKLLDEEKMKRYQLQQLKIDNQTELDDIEMKIKVSAMKLNRMEAELRNEQYLDSLGSGTTEKVRQAELAVNTARLELEQLKKMYKNELQVKATDLKVKELEVNIFSKSLKEMKRTLDDAQLRSPRKAILTYINQQVGAQISQGEQVAVISDLSHFKIDAEIADSYADKVMAGGQVIVRIGKEKLTGHISSVTPLSKNGVISFSVQLDDDHKAILRSGIKTDVFVLDAVKDDVIRIANGSYYMGSGEYELFVMQSSNELVKRKVQLGESNFEYVEVLSGLQEGDKVIVSDMNQYKNKHTLKLKL